MTSSDNSDRNKKLSNESSISFGEKKTHKTSSKDDKLSKVSAANLKSFNMGDLKKTLEEINDQ